MASELLSHLPPFEGLLPKWFLLVSIISIANSIQAYSTLHYATRMYSLNPGTSPKNRTPVKPGENASQVTPLSSRMWGTWTTLTGIVRLYVAYNINQKPMYELGMWTYGVAWVHYMSEWWWFGTTKWGAPLAGPIVISTGSLVWMYLQRDFYLGQ